MRKRISHTPMYRKYRVSRSKREEIVSDSVRRVLVGAAVTVFSFYVVAAFVTLITAILNH